MLDCDSHDNRDILVFGKDFVDPCMCNAWVATAIVGAAIVGGASQVYAASKASDAQVQAANTAAQTSMGMYEKTRKDLEPYRVTGEIANDQIKSRLSELTAPITMDEATLRATPGYQFTRTQGLKAAQNSAAARGLGVSGAALKGAEVFATGLADNTQKTQFDMANTNKTNSFNRLKALVDTGQNAAAQTGSAGTSAATTAAGAQIGAGNAQAAGYNAMGQAVNNSANNIAGYAAYKGLYGSNTPAYNNPYGGVPNPTYA